MLAPLNVDWCRQTDGYILYVVYMWGAVHTNEVTNAEES